MFKETLKQQVLGTIGQEAFMSLIEEKGEEVARNMYKSLYKYNPQEFEEYYSQVKQNGN